MATQFSGSLIRVGWNFSDDQTAVSQHFWRLVSEPYTRNPIPARNAGSQPDDTTTEVEFSDGEEYYALVTACNAASLCMQNRSTSVTFDSSPPIDGYFAVDSSVAAALNRTVAGGMTWRNRRVRGYAEINVAFLGFSDPHSGVARYWTSVGSGLSQDDLLADTVMDASPASNDNSTYIGRLQLNRLLDLNETIYVSLWAENGVGLRSHVIQGSFTIDEDPLRSNNGTMTILRSYNCPIDSCLGHCTCAARGDLCTIDVGLTSACREEDLSVLSSDMEVQAFIDSPQQMSGVQSDPTFTASVDKLIGRWELVNPTSTAIRRIEWSFGEEGLPPGTGLMDSVNDLVWRQADGSNRTVFSVSPSYPLRHSVGYVFHVRAWYSNTSFAIFTSRNVTVDTVFPTVVVGSRVRELDGSSDDDVDFTFSDNEVTISWQDVFIQSLSGAYSTYEVAIGDTPGSDNIYPFTVSSLTRVTITDLTLTHGRKYYSTVRATSPLGVREVSVSDGFTVDLSPPAPGVVLDGMGMEYVDAVAQFRRRRYSARWFGFGDPESGIHHYELAFTNSLLPPGLEEYTDVGISLRETMIDAPPTPLDHGEAYYAHIVAVNNAGTRSHDVASNGIIIDNDNLFSRRPSARRRIASADGSLLLNPSFESSVTSDCRGATNLSIYEATQNWTLATALSELVTASTSSIPYDKCIALLFSGSISQSFPTAPGVEYELSFALKRDTSLKLAQAVVSFPGHTRTISLLSQKVGDSWLKYSFIFTSLDSSNVSEISVATVDDSYALLVDDFSVVALNYSDVEITTPVADIVVSWPEAIHVSHSPISQSWTQLYASWDVVDPESGVREYLWAVGTVPGGEQLQSYTSTGGERQGVSEWLSLSHGQVVYVSVVAWNYAGQERVVHSEGYFVDLTPPTFIGDVNDGTVDSVDLDFQSDSTQVGVVFSACQDPESGLREIRWAVGKLNYVAPCLNKR